ncbi:MAG: TolC family protein, partial [Calditrichaeota bacterium]
NIMAFANFHYAKPGLDPVANSWMTYFTTGISLQWNLWRGGNDRRKIENLIIQNEKLHLEEEDLKRMIDTEVEESFENLQISLKNYHLSLELKNQQAERYRIVSNQYENGLASTLDLVTAELDLTRAELQTQQALSNYYMNLAKLKKAAGILHPLNED